MSATPQSCKVSILVKALPQPSKQYGETVCCAGVTVDGRWKRLFPIRYRHLSGGSSFARWDWVTFRYRRPTTDTRAESCHVFEDSIAINGKLRMRDDFLKLCTRASIHASRGRRSPSAQMAWSVRGVYLKTILLTAVSDA
jgi:hypothetical protein